MKQINKKGFSVILAILMTGFMIFLTTGIFMLVLSESKDTKAMESYTKAYQGAEGGLELAMLRAKNNNYSFDEKVSFSHPFSNILLKDIHHYNQNKDVKISYTLSGITSEITDKSIEKGGFEIIPLFSFDNHGNYKGVKNLQLSGINTDVVWNIVGKETGMSGNGNFTTTTNGILKTFSGGVSGGEIQYQTKSIGDFLATSDYNYLILHNVFSSSVSYTLQSLNPGEFITRDVSTILSSGEIKGLKQNLSITIRTSEYLHLLKYSIFSE